MTRKTKTREGESTTEYAVQLPADFANEEKLAAIVIANPDSIYVIKELIISPDDFYFAATREFFRAVWSALEAREEPNEAAIKKYLKIQRTWGQPFGDVTLDDAYFARLDRMATMKVRKDVRDYAGAVAMYSQSRETNRIASALEVDSRESPEQVATVLAESIEKLNAVQLRTVKKRDASAGAIGKSLRDKPPANPRPTGITFVDSLGMGYSDYEIWSINGPYKQRKTTFARAILEAPLLSGESITWCTVDGNRERAYDGWVAALATRWMQANGVAPSSWRLSAKNIRLRKWRGPLAEAIAWAEATLAQSNLRIYDNTDKVRQLDYLEQIIYGDILIHKARVYVVDFLQKIKPRRGGKGWTDSPLEQVTDRLGDLTTSQPVCGIWLNQLNDTSIKVRNDDSAGVKGGGAPSESADFVWRVGYNKKDSPERFSVELQFSRYSETGQIDFDINPSSGMILKPDQGGYQAIEGYESDYLEEMED